MAWSFFGLATVRQGAYRIPPVRRILAILGSAVFLVIAPGTVAGYVPWIICRWHLGPPLLGISSVRFVGVLLIVQGFPYCCIPSRALRCKVSVRLRRSFQRAS
jgi:hypothetical protein